MPEHTESHLTPRQQRQASSNEATGGHAPACMFPIPGDEPAALAYCAYNAAGDPSTAGKNYQGKPCPVWEDLPENIRVKWRAAVAVLG